VNVICVCPVKDEAAHLDRFLGAASCWATHIIIADQGSTDGSVEITRSYPKARVIHNDSADFNEPVRQKLLIDAARQVAGPRVIVALDADEALSANVLASDEWRRALAAPPGTAIFFQWVNLLPGLSRAWITHTGLPWAYVDDGREHVGAPIHSSRVPCDPHGSRLDLDDVKVLHYQFTDWELMRRKHYWYQCWELLHTPGARACDIHRRYHHMDRIGEHECVDVKDDWFTAYEAAGIAVREVRTQPTDKWDRRVIELLFAHGPERFRHLDIWSVDWRERARALGRAAGLGDQGARVDADTDALADPRRPFDRLLMNWMRRAHRRPRPRLYDRAIRRLIRPLGW
jgi:hypothetical protein